MRTPDAYQTTNIGRYSPLRRIADELSVPAQDVNSLIDSESMWLTGEVQGSWTTPASNTASAEELPSDGDMVFSLIADADDKQTETEDRDPSPLGPGDFIQMDLGQGRTIEIEVASVIRRQRPVPPSDETRRAEPTDGYSILSPIDSNDDPAAPAPLDTEHLA